jgi:hypothetical protein
MMSGMAELPAFIEISPDQFKPLEQCTRDEILAAAQGYLAHANMGAADAVREGGANGRSVVSEDLMSKANEDHTLGENLLRYGETV